MVSSCRNLFAIDYCAKHHVLKADFEGIWQELNNTKKQVRTPIRELPTLFNNVIEI